MTEGSSTRHLGHVARGGAINLLGSVVNAVAGVALVVLIARGLEPDVAGRFFAASSVVLLLAAVAGLGTPTGLARFMLRFEAQGRHADVLRVLRIACVPVVVLSLLLCAALLLLAGPVANLLGWEGEGALVRALALALPFAVATETALGGTRALGRMRTTALVDRMVRSGLQAVLAAVVLAAGGGVVAVALAWTAAWVVAAVLSVRSLVVFLRKRRPGLAGADPAQIDPAQIDPAQIDPAQIDPARTDLAPTRGDRTSGSLAAEFWSYTRWRAVARVAQVGIQRADVILVAALVGPAESAVYTAATRFVVFGQFVTQALGQVLQPRFTSILVEGDTSVLREVLRTGTAWSIALTWPVYLVIGCAPGIYLSLFGAEYGGAEATTVVLVMTAAMMLAVAAGAVDTLLLMAGRSGLSVFNTLTALVVDVVGCLLLLPVLGIPGAAASWAAAVVLRNGLAIVQVRRELGVAAAGPAIWTALALPPLVVGVPVGATFLLVGGLVPWLVSVLVAGLLYLAVLYRFRRLLRLDVLMSALPYRRLAPRVPGRAR